MKRLEQAFSLVEVLAALSVLTIGALATTSVWRLADYQAFVTRLDDRAARLLRECYERETFSPTAYKPFDRDGNPAGETLTQGYLYHPWNKASALDSSPRNYADDVPYTISLSPDRTRLVLQYVLNHSGTTEARQVTRAIDFLPGGEEW
ncbi:MAG TPA: prepilin-type N-terminal cleavage/methylation domain-containing protein [Chthoniobacterales bacterium]